MVSKDVRREARGARGSVGHPASRLVSRRAGGFTLLELIIVVAIIGILAAIISPNLRDAPTRAKEAVLKTDLATMRKVIDQYHADKGYYPPDLATLVDEDYLRAVPIDPFTGSAQTWRVEYMEIDFELEPIETEESETGEPGIIDVYSGADATALDGTRYSEW